MNTAAAFSFPCTAEPGWPRPPSSIVYSRRRLYTAACDLAGMTGAAAGSAGIPRRGEGTARSGDSSFPLGCYIRRQPEEEAGWRLGGGRSKSGAADGYRAKRGRDAAARPSPEEEERMHGASPSRGGNAAQRQRRNERGGGHLQSGYFLRDAAASVACPGVLASINGEGEKAAGRAAQPLAAATDARSRASGIPCLISSPLYSHVTRRAGGTRETRKGHVSASAANFPARARHELLLRAQTSATGAPPGQLHLQVNDRSWTEKYHRRDMAEDPCGQPLGRERVMFTPNHYTVVSSLTEDAYSNVMFL